MVPMYYKHPPKWILDKYICTYHSLRYTLDWLLNGALFLVPSDYPRL